MTQYRDEEFSLSGDVPLEFDIKLYNPEKPVAATGAVISTMTFNTITLNEYC